MAISGDGRGGIVQENTLHMPGEFVGHARTLFVQDSRFKQFDVVFTNPPFGSNIKVLKSEAANFQLGHTWKDVDGEWQQTDKTRATPPQVLFIERCLELLKPSGILAIVLPETVFHGKNMKSVMHFITNGNNIKAVVDLPHDTFRPFNNAKTCLLVVQKGTAQQDHILMAVAEGMGHDHGGSPLYRFDPVSKQPTEELWNDLELIRKEALQPYREDNEYVFMVDKEDISNDIYVPRYYWPRRAAQIVEQGTMQGITPLPIQQLLDEGIIEEYAGHGSPSSEYKGQGDVPYIRVADIVNWEMYKNPTTLIPHHVYVEKKGKNGVDLQARDIVFVRRASYRIGTVAMVSPYDTEVLLTKEFVVMRIVKENEYGIDPYYLLYLLSHELTQRQLYQKVLIETTLPNIGDRWKELWLPVARERTESQQIARSIRAAIEGKWAAQAEITALRQKFGGIVT